MTEKKVSLSPEEQEALLQKVEKLKNDLLYQQNLLNSATDKLMENQEVLSQIHNKIMGVRRGKLYRISVALQRMIKQVLRGNREQRRDFFRWAFAKLKKSSGGRPLHEFDLLIYPTYTILQQLDQNQAFLSNLACREVPGLIRKRSRQIFMFGNVPYYDVGGGQRSAQIANAFNAMGYEVYYIYGFESSESKRETMYVPAVKHLHIDSYSLEELKRDVRENAVFFFEAPYGKYIPYLDFANENGHVSVYEHIDNWDSSLGCLFYKPEDFQYFMDKIQHVTVTARILGEKIEEFGRTDYLYSANAVDSSLFEPTKSYVQPEDLVIGKKTLLYFGSLWGEWFDWDLIVHVAKNCDCEINLIGDCQPIQDKIKTLPKNIHFLGLKKHDDLPAYLAYTDITLLPFKNSIIGKYVSPLKIFEYLAMNKPVLATPLDDILGYPNMVASEDKEVWAKAVNEGIPTQDATVFTAENSWFARCNKIMDHIGREEKNYPKISVIILNRNNKNVIFRCVDSVMAFSGCYDYEIIVVDNDSTDGSYEMLQQVYGGKIKLLKNDKNGCSSGRNLGVKQAEGELLLFLDSDQWIVGEHYMDASLDLLLNEKDMGAVGWATGWFENGTCSGLVADNLPNRGIIGPWVMARKDIAYLGTGGFVIRKELFEAVGGFDEFYDPTCYEDTDLSLKVRHAGKEIAYCPYMNIMHLPHQTTKSGTNAHTKLMERNASYFMEKWTELDPKLLDYSL